MPNTTTFIVALKADGEELFWSNENGWGDRASATCFTRAEREAYSHPEPSKADQPNIAILEPGARWVEA